jgi:DNA modification methylase
MKRKPKSSKTEKKAAKHPKPPERALSPPEPVTAQAEVRISKAKGRPMLTWVGKRPLERVTTFPAQLVETFNPTGEKGASQNLLFHGDNKEVLAYLLANGFRRQFNLIYIDPPFDSGADYVRKVQLRGIAGAAKIEGETYTLGEQIQYTDIWANDNYLQFMYERLMLLKELLADNGSIYVHCDQRKHHHLRFLLDEIFGNENFRNEIIRVKCNPKNFERPAYGNIHDVVLFYSKGDHLAWNDQVDELESEDIERLFPSVHANGRRYTTVALHAAGERRGPTGQPWRNIGPPPGRHWANVPEDLDKFDAEGLIEWSSTGNPRLILYADERGNRRVQDIWTMKDPAYPIYPTEKNEGMLHRIIQASSNAGEVILDCFIGSGTTAAVAQRLGRRWIGCDINKGAIQTTSKRLQTILLEQIDMRRGGSQTAPTLPGIDLAREEPLQPAFLAFSVYRVNDYDLQIQHNEAVNLACEHIGIERTRADAFFDGTLGKRLAKIIPFNHPLSPLDLEEIKKELKSRPEEDRGIVVVALGKEHAIDVWLEDWNRLRKQGRVPNRIDVIELRTDEKYGKFFVHKPAQAEVKFAREKDKIVVEIKDFLSPTIIERLTAQEGVLKPQITDWRSMVDSVMIDTAYDGKVFNIVLSDVPQKKADLVKGRYELPAPKGPTTVAVKVTDMLGEEVLVPKEV